MDLHIKDVLKRYVQQDRIKKGYLNQRIAEYWQKEMGVSIASRTKKIFLNKGQLTIILNSASLKNELFMNRERIARILNDHLGEEVVQKVVIR